VAATLRALDAKGQTAVVGVSGASLAEDFELVGLGRQCSLRSSGRGGKMGFGFA